MALVTFTPPSPRPLLLHFRGLTLLAPWPEQDISGVGGRPCLGCTSVPLQLCALCPSESLSAECLMWERVSVRKLLVRQPESEKESRWPESAPTHLHSPSGGASSLLSPLRPCPPGSQKPSLPITAPGLGSSSPHPCRALKQLWRPNHSGSSRGFGGPQGQALSASSSPVRAGHPGKALQGQRGPPVSPRALRPDC